MNSRATVSLRRLRAYERVADAVEQQRAVGQTREVIVQGAMRQLGLDPPPLADVVDLGDEVGHPAKLVADGRDSEAHPHFVAAPVHVALLGLIGRERAIEQLAQALDVGGTVIRVGDRLKAHRTQLRFE